MTSEQLDEIERMAEAATPGPYQVVSIYPAYGVFRVQVDEPSECVAMCAVSMNEDADESHVERQEAHARNGANARAIASLLRYALPLVKALREALDVSKGRREEAFDWISAYFEAQRERDEARAEVERLREALQEIAEGDCHYADNCPPNAGTRHGTCTKCKARQALKEGES